MALVGGKIQIRTIYHLQLINLNYTRKQKSCKHSTSPSLYNTMIV